jgi:hypothetical protein
VKKRYEFRINLSLINCAMYRHHDLVSQAPEYEKKKGKERSRDYPPIHVQLMLNMDDIWLVFPELTQDLWNIRRRVCPHGLYPPATADGQISRIFVRVDNKLNPGNGSQTTGQIL